MVKKTVNQDRSDAIKRGMAAKQRTEAWKARSAKLSASHILRFSKLSEDEKLDEHENRLVGYIKKMNIPEELAIWKKNNEIANQSFKPKNLVHIVTIPTIHGSMQTCVRGFESITIKTLTSIFGLDQLQSWNMRNDVMFIRLFVTTKLQQLQNPKIERKDLKLTNNRTGYINYTYKDQTHRHDFDHSLKLSSRDVPIFITSISKFFSFDESKLLSLFQHSDEYLVVIETKSFSSARHYGGADWLDEIVAKANQANNQVVKKQRIVYLVWEMNFHSLVLYAPNPTTSLSMLGVAIHGTIEGHLNYYDSFQSSLQLPIPTTYANNEFEVNCREQPLVVKSVNHKQTEITLE